MLSAVPLVANQLTALHTLCWAPWLLRCCTLCGAPVPVAPVPRCARCGRLGEPFEGTWQRGDEGTQRALAIAWIACHHHVCKAELDPLWRALDAKLRQRYGFPPEEAPCP